MPPTLDEIQRLSFDLCNIDDLFAEHIGLKPIKLKSTDFQARHDRLFDRWYASFDRDGDPRQQNYDYGVYSDPDYPYITLDCFKGWSRSNAVNTVKFFHNIGREPKSITYVFAGSGQTTVILAKAFPKAKVFYHNTDSAQIRMMQALQKRFGVKNVSIITEPQPAECVFAMETMEHILDPLKFTRPIINPKICKFYVDGSSFTIDSIGHFPIYMDGDTPIRNKAYKRHFFNELKKMGFHQSFETNHFVHKRFYNGRPNVLVHETAGVWCQMGTR